MAVAKFYGGLPEGSAYDVGPAVFDGHVSAFSPELAWRAELLIYIPLVKAAEPETRRETAKAQAVRSFIAS